MELTGAGTAIMVAVAALLWFLYFVPTWMRSREYRDTERTATRLQQTLRIMAETAELPEQVRVEASARDAARHERVLRAREHRADVLAARAAATVRAQTPAMPRTAAAVSWSRSAPPAPSAADAARLRRRRAHRLASALMVAATGVIGIQLALVLGTGFATGAWLVFAAGAACGVAGVVVRRRVDARSTPVASVTAKRVPGEAVAEQPSVVELETATSGWTPVPVPPPLYLSKPEAQPLVASPRPDELAAQLRAAARAAEDAVRAAHAEPEVTPIRPDVVAAAPSRWASMGRVELGGDAPGAAAPDLDEVLRRRRAAS